MVKQIILSNIAIDVYYSQYGQIKLIDFIGTWAMAKSYIQKTIPATIICYEIKRLPYYLPVGCSSPILVTDKGLLYQN